MRMGLGVCKHVCCGSLSPRGALYMCTFRHVGAMGFRGGRWGRGAYRSDLGGGAGVRQGLQGPPQAAAVTPHTQVAQVLPAQALGTVRAAHGAVIDLHCGRHGGSTGQQGPGS